MIRLLMVLTGADHLTLKDGSTRRTGCWAEEFVVPHELFIEAGFEVKLATPGGVEPPIDPESMTPERVEGGMPIVEHFKEYLSSLEDLKFPYALEELAEQQIDTYDGIFLPGGHGPMEDLAHSKPLGAILNRMQGANKLIGAVCHGPAGFLPATREDGTWTFQGYKLTAFTNQEEEEVGLADKVPFLLETRLRELGASFDSGPPWKPHVIVDRNMTTGQNPASSYGVAHEAIDWMSAQVAPR
jgi:putative intracellular protease/amidase